MVWPFDRDEMILGEYIYRGASTPIAEVVKRKLRPEEIGRYEEAA